MFFNGREAEKCLTNGTFYAPSLCPLCPRNGTFYSMNKTQNPHRIIQKMRFLINISGIISFDSPYFGLHPNVVLKTGLGKAKEAVPTQLPKTIPSSVAPLAKKAVNELIPEKVTLQSFSY